MEKLLTNYQLVSTGKSNLIPTDTNWYENDFLFKELSDLVNPTFKAWYCKRFYALGKERTLQLASIARADGKEPRRLFSRLLKQG